MNDLTPDEALRLVCRAAGALKAIDVDMTEFEGEGDAPSPSWQEVVTTLERLAPLLSKVEPGEPRRSVEMSDLPAPEASPDALLPMDVPSGAMWQVTAGTDPAAPLPRYTRSWAVTSPPSDDGSGMRYLMSKGAAIAYAMKLQNPEVVNWMRLEWVWREDDTER